MDKASNAGPRICFATSEYPPEIGGASKSAGRIVAMLASSGFDIHVFAPVKVDEAPAGNYVTIREDNVTIHRVYLPNKVNHIKQFTTVIREVDSVQHFDLFHGFFLHMAYPCLLCAKHRPVIASFRGIDAIWMSESVYKMIAREVLQKASWITSVSGDSLEKANALVPIRDRSSFISNSVTGSFDGEWKLSDSNRGVVGTVATFRPKKNIPLLARAYAGVEKHLRRRLLLVGDFMDEKNTDANKREEFDSLCAGLSVADQYTVTGYIDNSRVSGYLLGMNVFVLSSDHEGLPNSIIEAANLGLPIVSTAVDGVKDILVDGESGLLVPPGDHAALCCAITRVLEDDKLAHRLSEGSKRISRKLSPENEKNEWVGLYQRLLEKSKQPVTAPIA